MLDYLDVLALLHETRRPKTYLEIGVYRGASLAVAREDTQRVGVDPEPVAPPSDSPDYLIEPTTSDEFFAGPRPREIFGERPVDMVFIDGMHLFEHALRDFTNAEALSGPESVIVLHDCLPKAAETASRERVTVDWTGDVWKVVLCLIDWRPDLELCIIDVPPSGLCLVTGLNPGDHSLRDGYQEIIERYLPLDFADWEARLSDVLQRTTSSSEAHLWASRLEMAELHDELAEARAESGTLSARLDQASAELADTRDQLDQARADMERARAEAESRLRDAHAEASRLAAELAEQRAMLESVAASASWRLTGPVRYVGRASRSVRRRAGRLVGRVSPARVESRSDAESAVREIVGPAGLPVTRPDPLLLAREGERLDYRPTISILVPVYNTPPAYLQLAVESVLAQAYPQWELCLCDDGSTDPSTLSALEEQVQRDPRIRSHRLERNGGIAVASSAALAMSRGEYVALLDHDDELTPDALLEVAKVLNGDQTIDVVYTDQDYVHANGTIARMFYKPDWSLEMFRGVMYVGHLLTVRRSLAEEAGGFDPTFDNVQDFEFMLRLAERTERIAHLPKVLYHWRMIPGSVAFGGNEKSDIESRQAAAVNAHLARCDIPGVARSNPKHAHRLVIEPKPRSDYPCVSVIVRASGAESFVERCVETIFEVTSYPQLEIIVTGGAIPGAAAARLERLGVVLAAQGQSGSAAGQAGIGRATGQLVVSLSGDLEVQTPGWLEHLLFNCELPGVACVTPVILSASGEVASAGLALTGSPAVSPALLGWHPDTDGHAGSLSCVREVSAVGGTCYAVARRVLDDLGGPNPYYATDDYQAVDFSLRAMSRGLKNLCTPRARVRRMQVAESDVAGRTLDELLLRDAWDPVLRAGDPFWNVNLIGLLPEGPA